ncbi:MAG: hypothetical protein ACLVL7_10030 [Anaerotruncus massiliensis (ex Togo et al. 2019)]
MEFQHRMLRAVVAGIVDKALRDLPRDPKRSLRNLVDLGDSCAKGPQQKLFFARAHAALQSPASPYYQLAADAVSWVDPRALRAMGVNLGASGLTWGRAARQEEPRGGHCPDAPADARRGGFPVPARRTPSAAIPSCCAALTRGGLRSPCAGPRAPSSPSCPPRRSPRDRRPA